MALCRKATVALLDDRKTEVVIVLQAAPRRAPELLSDLLEALQHSSQATHARTPGPTNLPR